MMLSVTKKMTSLALCVAIALILSYVELLIPMSIAIPGFKVGICNIVIFYVLYQFGSREAVLVSMLRIFIMSLLFTNFIMMIYSVVASLLSITLMSILKRFDFGLIIISISGAIIHNLGQCLVACVLLDSSYLMAYFLPLAVFAIFTGLIIGMISGLLMQRIVFFK